MIIFILFFSFSNTFLDFVHLIEDHLLYVVRFYIYPQCKICLSRNFAELLHGFRRFIAEHFTCFLS
uniref:Uncharacterized protein n=1 Tax=uncultured marine virus TaxID=186617 RepID=A0A0F7L3Q7_9VIRU|nr:hypothetical protein [uncultured marine virus]